MKKLIFPVLALVAALTVSCNKEQGMESPAAKASQKVTIEASIAGTKTAYANDKTFSWLAGDKISVMEDLDGTVKFNEFTAASEGPTTTFNGEISDGATLGQWAVYPSSLQPAVTDGTLTIVLPTQRFMDYPGRETVAGYVTASNPMAKLPLVGQKQADDSYKFATAMGVVRFTLTNVPADASYFTILAAEGQHIAGTFKADADGTVKMENYVEVEGEGYRTQYYVIQPTEGSTMDFYFPVPVGTIKAGLTVELLDTDGNSIFSKTTVSDIEVVRNRVTEVAALECPKSSWKSLGTGKYNDAVIFGEDVYVDVEIEQDSENPTDFRMKNPYIAYFEQTGYTPEGTVTEPAEFFKFKVYDAATTIGDIELPAGIVEINRTYTGYYDTDYEAEVMLVPVTVFQETNYTYERFIHSRVLRYQEDKKTPANIQLAPVYYFNGIGGYLTDLTSNGNLQLVFPDCTPLDLKQGLSYAGPVEYPVADGPYIGLDVKLGTDLTAQAAVGSTIEEAQENLNSGFGTEVYNGSFPFALPEDAPTGTYYAVMQTWFDGDDWDLLTLAFDYVNPDTGGMTVSDIIGAYNVTAVDYSNPDGRATYVVIERSDDEAKGNVMFTNNFLGYQVNNWPIYATFDGLTGELSITDTYAFYWNSSYDSSVEGSYQAILNYHLTTEYGQDTDPVTFQFDEPGVFQSTYSGYIGIILYPSNDIANVISSVSGTRMETSGSSVAPKMKAVQVRMAPKVLSGKKAMVSLPADKVTLRIEK